jgi:hypothetical protein
MKRSFNFLAVLACTAIAAFSSAQLGNAPPDHRANKALFDIPVLAEMHQDPAPEPKTWVLTTLYRFTGEREDPLSVGTVQNITTLTRVFGKYSLSLDAFAGFTLRSGAPTMAVIAGYRHKLADQLDVSLHLGAQVVQGQTFSLPNAGVVGLTFNLRY